MSEESIDPLVASKAALNDIIQRRNNLLRQVYHMIRRSDDVGRVLGEEEDTDDLQAFLKKFDIRVDDFTTGSIGHLNDDEFLEVLRSSIPSKNSSPDHSVNPAPKVSRPSLLGTSPSPPASQRKASVSEVSQDHVEPLASRQNVTETTTGDLNIPDRHPQSEHSSPLMMSPQPSSNIGEQGSATAGDSSVEKAPSLTANQDDKMEIDTEKTTTEDGVSPEHKVKLDSDDMDTTESVSIGQEKGVITYHPGISKSQDAQTQQPSAQGHEGGKSIVVGDTGHSRIQHLENDQNAATMHDRIQSLPSADTQSSQDPPKSFVVPIPVVTTRHPVVVNVTRPVLESEYILKIDSGWPTAPGPSVPATPGPPRHQTQANYILPPLKYLPPEYNRKVRSTKLQRKREKNDGKKDKDEWTPLGLNRWVATVIANPVWKRVSRSSKCLSTRDWTVAMMELRLIRAVERVEALKREGRWSFRQPKKQRGVGGLSKTHWDHLLDEMKWMRIDFREERRWKIALAFNLSTAVLEWHAAGTFEERIQKGICVRWKPNLDDPKEAADYSGANETGTTDMDIDETDDLEDKSKMSLLGVDYGSDEEGNDEDAEKPEVDVADPLEPTVLIEDALDDAEKQRDEDGSASNLVQPKMEDIEDTSVLNTSYNADALPAPPEESTVNLNDEKDFSFGLKSTSSDPVLGSKPTPTSSTDEVEPPMPQPKLSSRVTAYAPIRELIAHMNDKLFIDADDFHSIKSQLPSNDHKDTLPDLLTIFPDLQPFGLLEVVPPVTGVGPDGKKRSEKRSDRDDPTKRLEETTYNKLFPVGNFMYTKPTLLGPLQPSKNWKDHEWTAFEDHLSLSEVENVPKATEDSSNELFDSRSSNSPTSSMALQTQAAILKEKEPRKRPIDHVWSPADDMLLKSLVDKYPNNWALIADCFNSSRITIPTERRTARDCLERWKEKWGVDHRQRPQGTSEDSAIPTSNQMTTRGVKRLASNSVSTLSPLATGGGGESRKRRRHILVQETIRKAAKKRAELAQKALASQRKPPAVHETHAQYNKMAKHTPAELSRMKAEKETRELQELQLARRRQEELNRQSNMLQQGNRMNIPMVQQQQQQQQQLLNAAQRTNSSAIPPIRSQVNISQQQRNATPTMPVGNPRLSPQQLMQVQAQAQAQQARAVQVPQQQVQQSQAQAQVQNGHLNNGSIPTNSPHLAPYVSRDNTSSPAHLPPPNTNTANSPRPPSAQPHPLIQATQAPGNAGVRPAVPNNYYLANMQNLAPEQLHTLRHQLQQQQQQQQQQAQQQGSQALPTNFPQPS